MVSRMDKGKNWIYIFFKLFAKFFLWNFFKTKDERKVEYKTIFNTVIYIHFQN